MALSVAVGLFHLPGQRRFVRAVCKTVIKRTRSFAEFVRSFAESKCSVRGTRRIGSHRARQAGTMKLPPTGYKDDIWIYSAKLRVRLITVPSAAPNPPAAPSAVTPRVDARAERSLLDIATARRTVRSPCRGGGNR